MYRCPYCSSTKGFIKDIYPCVVAVRVDANLEEVGDLTEIVDYVPFRRSTIVYECINCSHRFRKVDLMPVCQQTAEFR